MSMWKVDFLGRSGKQIVSKATFNKHPGITINEPHDSNPQHHADQRSHHEEGHRKSWGNEGTQPQFRDPGPSQSCDRPQSPEHQRVDRHKQHFQFNNQYDIISSRHPHHYPDPPHHLTQCTWIFSCIQCRAAIWSRIPRLLGTPLAAPLFTFRKPFIYFLLNLDDRAPLSKALTKDPKPIVDGDNDDVAVGCQSWAVV